MFDKAYFTDLAKYNIWANNRFKAWLLQIPEEHWSAPITSSFGNIGATVWHLAGAQKIWLERLKELPEASNLPKVENPERNLTLSHWVETSDGLLNYVRNRQDGSLEEPLEFVRANGEKLRLAIYQILSQVFNHSTYHRGQILLMLKQIGFDKVGSTDLVGFYINPN